MDFSPKFLVVNIIDACLSAYWLGVDIHSKNYDFRQRIFGKNLSTLDYFLDGLEQIFWVVCGVISVWGVLFLFASIVDFCSGLCNCKLSLRQKLVSVSLEGWTSFADLVLCGHFMILVGWTFLHLVPPPPWAEVTVFVYGFFGFFTSLVCFFGLLVLAALGTLLLLCIAALTELWFAFLKLLKTGR
jgi:hypothetical protein